MYQSISIGPIMCCLANTQYWHWMKKTTNGITTAIALQKTILRFIASSNKDQNVYHDCTKSLELRIIETVLNYIFCIHNPEQTCHIYPHYVCDLIFHLRCFSWLLIACNTQDSIPKGIIHTAHNPNTVHASTKKNSKTN